jgi:phage terminase small subunit
MNARQQAFVAYKLAHPSASDYEAARAAGYPVESSRSIPSRVANHPSVVAALESRVALVAAQASLSRESHLADLERLRDLAVQQGQLSAAITAEHHRGKVGGFYVDKVALSFKPVKDMTDDELEAEAKRLGLA